jgi:hypothetical protein
LEINAGSAAVAAPMSERPTPGRRPPVPPMNSSEPPGRAGRLEADARAAADHDDGLTGQAHDGTRAEDTSRASVFSAAM